MSSATHRGRGFSGIELAVVLAILVLLSGVLVPIARREVERSRVARAGSDLKVVADAFVRYFGNTTTWPSNGKGHVGSSAGEELVGYACLFDNVFERKGWSGPYLTGGARTSAGRTIATTEPPRARGLLDPWGRPYRIYTFAAGGPMGAQGGIVLVCAGSDGVVNTPASRLANAAATGDDVVQIVTRRL
ncbi:MAG TPA: hypothetical protein VKE69_03510 [Planctomycetota bacterium]|nr:hypothetical protein [Planctomycetota bacterium]